MNRILPLASLVLAAGALQAQSTTMKVTDVITAQANRVTRSFAKDQVIRTRAIISARDGTTHMRTNAAASKMLRHGLNMHSNGSFAMVTDNATAQAGTNTASVGGKGKVEVVFNASKRGSLVLTYYGRVLNGRGGVSVTGGATFSAAADGTRHSKTFTIKNRGKITLLIDSTVSAKALARAGAYASGSFSAVFLPEGSQRKITITKGASSCKEGGVLSGTASSTTMGHRITLTLAGSLPNAFAINLASASARTVLLPGSKTCNLFTMPMWAGMARTDRGGNAITHLHHTFMRSMTLYDQMVTISFGPRGLKLVSSNQVKIVVQ